MPSISIIYGLQTIHLQNAVCAYKIYDYQRTHKRAAKENDVF